MSNTDIVKRVWGREDVQFIAHCVVILGLLVFLRNWFIRATPAPILRAVEHLVGASPKRRHRSASASGTPQPSWVPSLVPSHTDPVDRTVERTHSLGPVGKRNRAPKPDHGDGSSSWRGQARRSTTITTSIRPTCWTGFCFSCSPALSWKFPLAVPFAVKWAYVMIKESYVPIRADDFDFRAVHEVLIIFSGVCQALCGQILQVGALSACRRRFVGFVLLLCGRCKALLRS